MAEEQEQGTTGELGFDLDAGVSDIAGSLGLGSQEETQEPVEEQAETPVVETPVVEARKPPQSWAKEKHELWSKLPPEAQEYYELREKQMAEGLAGYKEHYEFGSNMRKVFEPYRAILQSQGVDEAKAAQFLLNAHYKLSTAQPGERQQYFAKLAKDYGVDLASLAGTSNQEQLDPNVRALKEEVEQLKSGFTANQQAAQNEAKAKIAKEVEAFASDPKHVYFDECSEDIVALVQAGNTLQQAYEKAVYANPVTRAKELARLQAESEKAMREKAKAEAEAARRASSTNVRSRDTRKAPTEPKGTMEDTMRDTLKSIRERAH